MEGFSISDVYFSNGCRMIDINPLPEDYCSFDCVFCPLGRTAVKTDQMHFFEETREFINRLKAFLDSNEVDIVFINPDGEGLANIELKEVIKAIKERKIKVALLSNGYILNRKETREALSMCDEVTGELAVTNENDFNKLLRPIEGYTLAEHVNTMAEFRKWFKGKFILDINIIKNYSDSDVSVEIFKDMIGRISPDEVYFGTPDDERFKGAFQVSEKRLEEIRQKLTVQQCDKDPEA